MKTAGMRTNAVLVIAMGLLACAAEGKHKTSASDRAWLPFAVRLYFFAGVDSVKMVHSFVFDGDQDKDFIRGLGVHFGGPMRQQAHNRHVRLAGETGLFAEPLRPIAGRRNPSPDLYAKQIAGKPIPNLEKLPGKDSVAMMAVWDDFKLTQLSADSFSIRKRHEMLGRHAEKTFLRGFLRVRSKKWHAVPDPPEGWSADPGSADGRTGAGAGKKD
jgi:hypothetical protein